MARSSEWEKLPMAQGDAKPAWPLPTVTPKFATWSVGGGRPFGCAADKCERWHAGIDLTDAPDGALIIAPEDALVVGIDRGWSEGSRRPSCAPRRACSSCSAASRPARTKNSGSRTASRCARATSWGGSSGPTGWSISRPTRPRRAPRTRCGGGPNRRRPD
ncbi:hypothetical protein [Nannocystis pusilla]|uniref:hypothetical protein n=1 Tax=Nannocystis pusilla TaxID=889268 RepID=UPI003B778C31